MSYCIDINGHANMYIDSDRVPRIGELIQIIPGTFDEQEESLNFRVSDVRHTLSRGVSMELPIVILEVEK